MKNLINFVRKGASLLGGAFIIASSGHALAEPTAGEIHLLAAAEVVILGEVHDNAAHHQIQADILNALAPKAVVWEMITQTQAAALSGIDLKDATRVSAQLDWENSGWPEFELYAPVFAAATGAQQFGGLVLRSQAGAVMERGAASYFGDKAALFGLDQRLPEAEQKAREADQLSNHCNALPIEMLPMMVEFQRLRDAALAKATLQALKATGGPVAVITGNGHARKDRGIPVYLTQARPDLSVVTVGQSEKGQVAGAFDLVLDSDPVERPDPCLAFQ
ncbi:ChaN family lipoprotein [Parasedimentitalea huanghaiensis]|uniref:Haem-binding uptake Tiki superfamily ChaN domain-containing protein n=1 Tax=Parasedimentitalea huanghaiensis TaxID=2682100 RepID=A0A6L6WH86_9RHOB|nr:ChaN family lipoprotein [Zongyanglinia huanghaiensis]MVO17213.1 hypothetical protein [Zongyanglinia huanghaiensis]